MNKSKTGDRISIMPACFTRLLVAVVFTVEGQEFSYVTNNGSITITGYNSTNSLVEIPSTLSGLPVTSIGGGAFFGNGITSVVIIPAGVTSIGDGAFEWCGLTSVTIPNSVTNIGDHAFAASPGLHTINVDVNNQFFSSADGVLVDKGRATLLQFPIGNGATSYSIPNGVTSIGLWAFLDSQSLTNVTFPGSVSAIGDRAFEGGGLTSVAFPNTLTEIGDGAFRFCRNLTNVYFQGDAPSVYSTSFSDNSGSVTAYYLPGTTGWEEFATTAAIPTAVWSLPYPLVLPNSVGVQSSQFSFTVSWATNQTVVIEVSSNLASGLWIPIATNAPNNGTFEVGDPNWKRYPARFFRLRRE